MLFANFKIQLVLLAFTLSLSHLKVVVKQPNMEENVPAMRIVKHMTRFDSKLLESTVIAKGINVYCRATLCFEDGYDTTLANEESYYLCLPNSNVDCKSYDVSSMTYKKIAIEKGKLWKGIGRQTFAPEYEVTEKDVIIDNAKAQTFPSGMEWKGCTMDGSYETSRCSSEVMPYQTIIQVVLINGIWIAAKDMVFVKKEVGTYKFCWSDKGFEHVCKTSAQEACKCVDDYSIELNAVVEGVSYPIGGYGSRVVTAGYQRIITDISECDISHTNGMWKVHGFERKSLNVIHMKKGTLSHSCDLDPEGKLCVPETWLKAPGVLKIEVYEKGRVIASCDSFVGVVDSCAKLGVWGRFKDWNCWTALEWILLISIITVALALTGLILSSLWLVCSLLGCTCKWCFRGTRAVGKYSFRKAWKGLRGLKGRIEEEEIRPLAEQEVIRLGEVQAENNIRFREGIANPRNAVRTNGGVRVNPLTGMFMLIMCLTPITNANLVEDESCSNIEMTSFKTTCADDDCVMEGSIRLTVPSGGTMACFKPAADQIRDTLYKLQIVGMELSCNQEDSYFTTDYNPESCSIFSCPSECPSDPKDAWKMISTCVDKGIRKQANMEMAPSCAGMGCILCSSACVVWKAFFVPEDGARPVRVFKCASWVPRLRINFVTVEGGIVKRKEGILHPAVPLRIGDFKVVWNSYSIAPSLVFQKSFLQDGDRICYLEASPKGAVEKNKVGYVQCPTEQDVMSVSNCTFDPTHITCHMANPETAHCQFLKQSWKEACKDSWLPRNYGGYLLESGKEGPIVSQDSFGSLEITFTLDKPKRLAAVASAASCNVPDATIEGCYNCPSGARLNTETTPTKGVPLVFVTCENGIHPFSFRCGTGLITVNAYESSIDTRCIARWGLKFAEFQVSGTLVREINLPGLSMSSGEDRNLNYKWRFNFPLGSFLKWFGVSLASCAFMGLGGYLLWLFIIRKISERGSQNNLPKQRKRV